jgi:hypothetical protein
LANEGTQTPLSNWRQGDIILAPFRLPIVVENPDGDTRLEALAAEHGVAIVSQTCDVVKGVENCPFIQVAPLVPIGDDEKPHILRGKRPRLVIVPELEARGLAIDLDACATVRKDVIATVERVCGCPDDASQAIFGRALARHRGRFAFPDQFNNEVAAPIAKWIKDKYKKQGPHGELANAIVEVRVTTDDWDKPTFLTFYFLIDGPMPTPIPAEWEEARLGLVKKASTSRSYPDVEIELVTFDDLSAAEYLAGVELDWDGLSPAP